MGVVPFDGPSDAGERKVSAHGLVFGHHQKGLGPGDRHHAIEQRDGVGDRAGGEVIFHRQRLFHHRVRVLQRIRPLRHAKPPEIFAGCVEFRHVTVCEQGKIRVRAAKAVRIGSIHREAREGREQLAEAVDLVGVARHAGDDVSIARLHGAGRAAQGHDAGSPAHRDRVEPARAEAQMLGQPHGRVGEEREGRDREAVDVSRFQPRRVKRGAQGARDPEMRCVDGIALIGHRHGGGQDNAVISLPPTRHQATCRFLRWVRSCAAPSARSCAASALSSARWIFCVGVRGRASTKAM